MTCSRALLKPFSILSLLAPMPAMALEPTTTNVLMQAISLSGFCFINLLLTILFFYTGKYQSERFAKMHTLLSIIPAIISLIASLTYIDAAGGISLNVGVIIVCVALSLLPIQLSHSRRAPTHNTPKIIAAFAALLLLLSYFMVPLSLFAVAAAHVAASSQSSLKVKSLCVTILTLGYCHLGFWAYQIVLHS
ncbi:hypothetical protein [Shewanella youngdeokensis]|uniref:Uncharacterized protein n=1 Tax=Shewanella youngdeokensis TaxID=2999068 RepID=A0ABZ0JX93_9GAMM|nr:hypothetical protein RGE70_12295 [Shewanella sp. DAU334]